MIIGHQKQWEFLKKTAELGKISHAYLFSGPEKTGKKTLALEWISFILGENISRVQHPDFILVDVKNNEDKKEIQIADIRELCWRLSLKPFSAPLKAAVINQAHLMNQEAQNSLLKTLEEPKGRTVVILVTNYPEMLFPTILSRVQIIKFYPVQQKEIDNYLKKQEISEKERLEIAAISWGRPGLAIDFILDKEKLKRYQQKLKEIVKLSSSPLATRFQYAKKISQDPKELKEELGIWLNYFRNILLSQINNQKFSSYYPLPKLKRIIKTIQNIIFLISTTNVNPKLALEIVMLEL